MQKNIVKITLIGVLFVIVGLTAFVALASVTRERTIIGLVTSINRTNSSTMITIKEDFSSTLYSFEANGTSPIDRLGNGISIDEIHIDHRLLVKGIVTGTVISNISRLRDVNLPLPKAILSFNFNGLSPAVIGIINDANNTISLTVPYGTNVTSLVPTIRVNTSATVVPASGVARNFTSPVTYTVFGSDGTTRTYVVTVTIAPQNPSSSKAITSFKFNGLSPVATGIINETNHTISVTVPFGTSVLALVPTITISPYATISPTSGTAKNFTRPVTYTVTAQNNSTQSYVVTVNGAR